MATRSSLAALICVSRLAIHSRAEASAFSRSAIRCLTWASSSARRLACQAMRASAIDGATEAQNRLASASASFSAPAASAGALGFCACGGRPSCAAAGQAMRAAARRAAMRFAALRLSAVLSPLRFLRDVIDMHRPRIGGHRRLNALRWACALLDDEIGLKRAGALDRLQDGDDARRFDA